MERLRHLAVRFAPAFIVVHLISRGDRNVFEQNQPTGKIAICKLRK